ncbi:MAG: ExbD/TolR family protein [Nevskiales bacterium]
MSAVRAARRLHRRHHQSLAPPGLLNLTSMIDIFTVLLFFLLVYAAELAIFTPLSVLKLNLPGPQAQATPVTPPLQIEIVLRRAGMELLRNGASVQRIPRRKDGADYLALAQQLRQLKLESPVTREIVLRPEPQIAYEELVQVMDAARVGAPLSPAPAGAELFPDIRIGDAPALISKR